MKAFNLALLTSVAMALAIPEPQSDAILANKENVNSQILEDIKPQELSSIEGSANVKESASLPLVQATEKEAAFIKDTSFRVHVIGKELGSLNMGLAYGKYLDVRSMSELRSESQKLREETLKLGQSVGAKKLLEDLDGVSRGFDNVIDSMERMCKYDNNKYDFCAISSADKYLDRARGFKDESAELFAMMAPESDQGYYSLAISLRYKDLARRFEVFELLETSHWTSGDKTGASAEMKAAVEAFDKITAALKKKNQL